jgi:phenylacetic acid degradation operon negative regulatory protein
VPGKSNEIGQWVKNYIKKHDPRSKSLIITVFGDSIAPYSNGIWLGDLISLMSEIGVNERLVRTSAFRLTDENWLSSERQGRKSFYSLTNSGTKRFEAAYRHIYKSPSQNWDGKWTLVIIQRNNESTPERSELRRDLEWDGFTLIANGVFIHPTATVESAKKIVTQNGFEDLSIVFRVETGETDDKIQNDIKIRSNWNLENVNSRYRNFITEFSAAEKLISQHNLTPRTAFQVQTLMIHSFRRANLHDPQLPESLLPRDWPGQKSFELCGQIYENTCRLSHEHVSETASFNSSIESGTRLNISVEDRFRS